MLPPTKCYKPNYNHTVNEQFFFKVCNYCKKIIVWGVSEGYK